MSDDDPNTTPVASSYEGNDSASSKRSFTYNAFLSYSQEVDSQLASDIQSLLHRLGRPWYRLRALRIFRDQSSLTASASLWASLERALTISEYFLLLASPKAAQSTWVEREVEWWLNNRPLSNFLILLGSGDISWDSANADFDWSQTDALPRCLRGRFSEEPRWVDIRSTKVVGRSSVQFRSAVLDVAATLRSIPKDDLDGADVKQRRLNRIAASAAVIVSLTLGTISAIEGYRAVQQRNRAEDLLTQVLLEDARTALLRGDSYDATSDLSKLTGPTRDRLSFQILRQRASDTAVEHMDITPQSKADNDPLAEMLGSGTETPRRPYEANQIVDEVDGQSCATLSTDAKYLLFAGDSRSPQLWNLTLSPPQQISMPNMTVGNYCSNAESPRHIEGVFAPNGHEVLLPVNGVFEVLSLPDLHRVAALSSPSMSVALFDPSGTKILSRTQDNVIEVWNAHTGERLHGLGPGTSFAFASASTRVLVLNPNDETAVVWDYESGKKLRSFSHLKGLDHGQLDPSGRSLLLFGDAGAKQISLTQAQDADARQLSQDPVTVARYSPDGSRIAIVSHETRIIDASFTGSQGMITTIRPDMNGVVGDAIRDLVFTPDGSAIVTTGLPAPATVWGVTSGNREYYVAANEDDIADNQPWGTSFGEISKDGSLFITIQQYGTGGTSDLRLWHMPKPAIRASFNGVNPLLGPDDAWLGLVHKGELRIFDLQSLLLIHAFPAMSWDCQTPKALLVTAGKNGVDLWNARTLEHVRSFETSSHSSGSTRGPAKKLPARWDGVLIDPTGTFVAATASTKEVFIWKVADGSVVVADDSYREEPQTGSDESLLESPDERPDVKLQWSEDGGFVIVFRGSRTLVWNSHDGVFVGELDPQSIPTDVQVYGTSSAATISFDATLGSGELHRHIMTWDLHDAKNEDSKDDDGYGFGSSFIGPNIVADSTNGSVIIRDRLSDKTVATFKQEPSHINVYAAILDGSVLLTGGDDRMVRLWDAGTMKVLRIFEGHTGPIIRTTIIPPDQIMTESKDQTVKLWRFRESQ